MSEENAGNVESLPTDPSRISEETIVNTTTMAIVLGVGIRRVQQMIQDGTLQTIAKGKLPLVTNVRNYIDFISDRQRTEEEKKLDKARATAEAKLKVAKATIAELQAKELSGKMHRSEDVQIFTQGLIDTVKSALLSMPGRLAVEVSLCDTAEECSVLIKEAVRDVLSELSEYEYDPEKYEALVRERQNLSEKPEEDVEE